MTKDATAEELENIKKLLVLLLYNSNVPLRNIAKASGMSTADIYKFVPKQKKGTVKKKKTGS